MGISERPSDMAQMGELVGRLREQGGYSEPRAFGLGIATVADADGSVLDTWFGSYNLDENLGAAALVAAAAGHAGGTGTFELESAQIAEVLEVCRPATADMSAHANLRVLTSLVDADTTVEHLPVTRRVVATFIEDLDAAPIDASDVYLRLHLLSSRAVAPHGVNLDGAFGLLTNVVWTTLGPCDVASFDSVRCSLRAKGVPVSVWGIDKFPRMVDYVVPTGVRIAEADRVRLGAHLAEGTTVMHEGFVNFNAGTLGPAMVEGRISAGVVVGANSDVGGSASIMGTLSGGGKEVISVGEDCLLGANSGLGISLGDRCVVEAGLYVTGGTIITLPDGSTCKARELSGRSDLLFRRNSQLGRVEVLPRSGTWAEGLNTALHSN